MMNVDNKILMSVDNIKSDIHANNSVVHSRLNNQINMDYKNVHSMKGEPIMQAQQTVPSQTGVAKKKRKRCGECSGCYRKDNCMQCGPCRSTRSHQICKMRKCEQLKTKKEKQRELSTNPVQHSIPVGQQLPTHIHQAAGNPIQQNSHLSHHLPSRLNQSANTGQPLHPSYSCSSNYQPGCPQVGSVISPSGPANATNPLMHLQQTSNNAYPNSSINNQNCGLPTNIINNNIHPSNAPPNQMMHHSTVQLHMQNGSDADQLNAPCQQMTTNSRLKSFIQSRQHNGITKTPVYSPTQSPINYNSNNFNPAIVNGNSLSPHYITTHSPGHQSQYQNNIQIKSDSMANVNNSTYQEQPITQLPPSDTSKSASQHSIVANAAAGYFSRHTANSLGNGQVTSQRLSGLSNQSDNQLTNNANLYVNGPHSQQANYINPSLSLYYSSSSSQQPSSNSNRNSGNRTQPPAIQQQLTSAHPQQIVSQQYAPTNNSTPSPLTASHNSANPMMPLSHRSKSVDLLNSNDNSNGSSSHSTSSLGQQVKMNNAQSPLNSTNLNNQSQTNQTIKTPIHQSDPYFNSNVTSSTQLQQQQSTTPINNYYGLTDNSVNNTPTSTSSNAEQITQDRQTNSLSNLLMDIGSSSPSTASSLAVTSLATYASLALDDQFEATTTLSGSSSTVTTNQATATGQQASTTAILNSNSNSNPTQPTSNNNQLPPVSTFMSNYWWENSDKTVNSTTSSTFDYATNHNLQPMEDELHNASNSAYFASLDQYSASNGSNVISNNYDYQYNGYHTESTPGEYNTGFTSLTSTLSN